MKKCILIGFLILIVVFAGCKEVEQQELSPKEKVVEKSATVSTVVGTGWSANDDPIEAVKEAIDMALKSMDDKEPEFAMIFPSSGSDMGVILSKVKEVLGNEVKIYGGTSDSRGVMTEKGFIKAEKKGYTGKMEGKTSLAIMLIKSEDIDFGVGSADYSKYDSQREASESAVLSAIESAGKTKNELPRVVLMTPTQGLEDESVLGIEKIVGKDTPILGGTTGGPKQQVFGKDKIIDNGISLSVLYTDLPIGWIFEGGFDTTTSESGIVTKVEGQAIVEIDNRPALDVYDEWLDGEISVLYEEVGDDSLIRDLLTLHPLYRKYTTPEGETFKLFSHPWPKDSTLKDRSVMTSTNIKEGERIYLSQGTWEILLNRIGIIPTKAKEHGGLSADEKPLFSIGYLCGGVMGTIPESGREKMPGLINYANTNAPFISTFTWGEQGHYPGLGSKHGNLQTGFLVIGQKVKE